ncbi:23S rRNA (adenine(2503)-C(2))-methyltransferase RlmN [[Mycoplasma] testudinis]|uniref:23S rRNA (adenine(2503)-C(2))-methyltransferase RlmN n=1 Tax=[Mycoplasma] testudinis TaxID=33924 RepID=UPI00048524BB|nr:23S rRNA (adenine(2503)-C(2))-methyltransferase RlmN [[Mycoplasma] testudinis]
METKKLNIYDYDELQLREKLSEIGIKPFVAKQVFNWLYQQLCESFDEMKNLSKANIELLKKHFTMEVPQQVIYQHDKIDNTYKFLYALSDNNKVETVVMTFDYGLSICVTTQVGCNMGCTFCASGLLKRIRNLTSGEIVGQLVQAQRFIKKRENKRISHLVVMGIGEPFDNFKNLMTCLNTFKNQNGFGLGPRNMTVSTCGIISKFKDFATLQPQVNLAISLHAPNNEVRTSLMPINKPVPIEKLLAAAKEYLTLTKRRLTFEYIMINGVNDSVEHAIELADKLKDLLCYVNLIPYNPVAENGYNRSTNERINAFYQTLKKLKIQCTVRLERGAKIDAACGQLRAKHEGVNLNYGK